MHILLKQKLHKLSADQIKLSPENPKTSGNLNRSSFYTSDEQSNNDSKEIYEIPTQGSILKIQLGQLTPDLFYESKLVEFQKQRKRINWLQTNLKPQWLLPKMIADNKHQDLFLIAWFTMHEEPLSIWDLYLHTAYTFSKMFNPIMVKESQFKVQKTSRTFPANTVDIQWQIEIAMAHNCPDDNIVKISESCSKHKLL